MRNLTLLWFDDDRTCLRQMFQIGKKAFPVLL